MTMDKISDAVKRTKAYTLTHTATGIGGKLCEKPERKYKVWSKKPNFGQKAAAFFSFNKFGKSE